MSPIDLHNLTDRPALFRALTYVIQLSAVGAIYFFTARFGLDLASVYPSATVIWPPAGFALAAVLLGGYRVVPAIFAAAFLVLTVYNDVTAYTAATKAGKQALINSASGAIMVLIGTPIYFLCRKRSGSLD